MATDRHTIRNLDRDLLLEARILSLQTGLTLGETLNHALEAYLGDQLGWEDESQESTLPEFAA